MEARLPAGPHATGTGSGELGELLASRGWGWAGQLPARPLEHQQAGKTRTEGGPAPALPAESLGGRAVVPLMFGQMRAGRQKGGKLLARWFASLLTTRTDFP